MPDGLGDFVDALNNPKEFLTKEEKRLQQLKERLGIDEKEISLVPSEKKLNTKVGTTSTTNSSSAQLGAEAAKKSSTNVNEQAKKEEPQIDKISRDTLKNMKGFQKLLKKQAKEKENLKKKHNKERALMQKQHSTIIDKMTANYDKSNNNNITNINNNNTSHVNNNNTSHNGSEVNPNPENNYKSKVNLLFKC